MRNVSSDIAGIEALLKEDSLITIHSFLDEIFPKSSLCEELFLISFFKRPTIKNSETLSIVKFLMKSYVSDRKNLNIQNIFLYLIDAKRLDLKTPSSEGKLFLEYAIEMMDDYVFSKFILDLSSCLNKYDLNAVNETGKTILGLAKDRDYKITQDALRRRGAHTESFFILKNKNG